MLLQNKQSNKTIFVHYISRLMSAYFFFLPKPAALLNQSPGKANSGQSVRANLQKKPHTLHFYAFLISLFSFERYSKQGKRSIPQLPKLGKWREQPLVYCFGQGLYKMTFNVLLWLYTFKYRRAFCFLKGISTYIRRRSHICLDI